MKNILVLIDNSFNSEQLALSAMNIALTIKADLLLVHTTKKNSADDDQLLGNAFAELNKTERLMEIADFITETNPKKIISSFVPKVECLLYKGCIADLLISKTNEGNVNLVLIGSHQSAEWERVMFRTQIQDILENIGCPLLIVPKKFVINQLKHITFAVDLRKAFKNSLRFVVSFSYPFKSTVMVNNISKLSFPQKHTEEDICHVVNLELDKNYPPVTYKTIRGANVKSALLSTIDVGNIDLLCLVHKNYDFLRGLFHVSMCKQLADNSLIPIIILSENYQ
jgi:nucleotide-binding universal stress UspA family protein